MEFHKKLVENEFIYSFSFTETEIFDFDGTGEPISVYEKAKALFPLSTKSDDESRTLTLSQALFEKNAKLIFDNIILKAYENIGAHEEDARNTHIEFIKNLRQSDSQIFPLATANKSAPKICVYTVDDSSSYKVSEENGLYTFKFNHNYTSLCAFIRLCKHLKINKPTDLEVSLKRSPQAEKSIYNALSSMTVTMGKHIDDKSDFFDFIHKKSQPTPSISGEEIIKPIILKGHARVIGFEDSSEFIKAFKQAMEIKSATRMAIENTAKLPKFIPGGTNEKLTMCKILDNAMQITSKSSKLNDNEEITRFQNIATALKDLIKRISIEGDIYQDQYKTAFKLTKLYTRYEQTIKNKPHYKAKLSPEVPQKQIQNAKAGKKSRSFIHMHRPHLRKTPERRNSNENSATSTSSSPDNFQPREETKSKLLHKYNNDAKKHKFVFNREHLPATACFYELQKLVTDANTAEFSASTASISPSITFIETNNNGKLKNKIYTIFQSYSSALYDSSSDFWSNLISKNNPVKLNFKNPGSTYPLEEIQKIINEINIKQLKNDTKLSDDLTMLENTLKSNHDEFKKLNIIKPPLLAMESKLETTLTANSDYKAHYLVASIIARAFNMTTKKGIIQFDKNAYQKTKTSLPTLETPRRPRSRGFWHRRNAGTGSPEPKLRANGNGSKSTGNGH